MSETIGSIVDKLDVVNLKMWNNQEILYRIRRMTFDEFYAEYCDSKEKSEALYNVLQKACTLNVQRNNLIDEVDKRIIELVKAIVNGEDIEQYYQPKLKTY